MIGTLEPRNIEAIIKESFRIHGGNLSKLAGITAIGMVAIYILLYISFWVLWQNILFPWLSIATGVVSTIIVLSLVHGALIHAISEQHFKHPVSISRAYCFAWRRWGVLIGAMFPYTLIVLAIMFIGALPTLSITEFGWFEPPEDLEIAFLFLFNIIDLIGTCIALYFAVRWHFIRQAIVLEGHGPIAAFSRSSYLVKRSWWRTLVIIYAAGIIAWCFATIIGASLGLLPVMFLIPTVGLKLGLTAGLIGIDILLTSIIMTAHTLLYYDLRVRKEGYNLETLAGELHIEPSGEVI